MSNNKYRILVAEDEHGINSLVEAILTANGYQAILALLARHAGKVLTHETVIKTIRGNSDSGNVKKLQVNMANIRKKLGETPGATHCIFTEIGVGYRMLEEES